VASDFYFPGLGLAIGIAIICGLGFLTTVPFFERILMAAELPFKNVPIIKSIYNAVKNLSDYFSPESQTAHQQQVVVVKMPGIPFEVVGLVTRQQLNDLPAGFSKDDRVAVFIPLSYMVGGLTVFVPRAHIQKIDMRVEVAMRSALTAWMPGRADNNGNGNSNGGAGNGNSPNGNVSGN
jgi:uncharacterized membrane protein